MLEGTSRSGLILWYPEIVFDWLARSDAYSRLRARAYSGTPALSVLVYADTLRTLRFRRLSESQIEGYVQEIKEQFVVLDLTIGGAEAFARAAIDCARLLPDLDVAYEAWFAWQVALCRREGHRIMTKAPQRYHGLVDSGLLA